MTTLILKRASASRPSGEWNDDDFDVLADGAVVGRIFKANAARHRERDHVIGIAMVIPMRHARFASLPERIRSTCVEMSRRIRWTRSELLACLD
jgi:hypothetical protein